MQDPNVHKRLHSNVLIYFPINTILPFFKLSSKNIKFHHYNFFPFLYHSYHIFIYFVVKLMANNDAINYNARLWAYASSSSSSSSSNGTEDDERLERNRLEDEAILRRSRQRRASMVGCIRMAHEIFSEGDVQRGGSVMGRRYMHRERSSRKELIMRDYFVEQPKFEPHKFRRRYRMQRELFWQIYQGVVAFDPYFTDRVDGLGRQGVLGLQKCMAAIHQLASGCSSDGCDEYHQLGDSTAMESLYRFTNAVIGAFEGYHLRRPTGADINFLLQQNAARGFPGMLGSIDCMH
jgi:hypothetical protein